MVIVVPEFFQKAREPWSSYTHFWGAVLFGVGGIGLLVKAGIDRISDLDLAGVAVFVLSLWLLYNASWVYHYVDLKPDAVLRWRKVDHSMIYVLIAGTYTPMCFHFYPEPKGVLFALVMWLIAILGIVTKIFWFQAPRWLSTAFYLVMGWAVLFNLGPVIQAGPLVFTLLLLGGLAYTAGGVIYGLKKPDLSKYIGFHEFFHLFVILGSLFHFLLVWICIA